MPDKILRSNNNNVIKDDQESSTYRFIVVAA